MQTIRVDRRLYNRDRKRARELEGWSIEGKLWSKPSSKVTVDQIVNRLDEKRKGKRAKDLSLDLYSRMINSFKNSYKSARKAFEKK